MNFEREIEAARLDLTADGNVHDVLRGLVEFGYQEGRKSVMRRSIESAKPISAQEAGFHE